MGCQEVGHYFWSCDIRGRWIRRLRVLTGVHFKLMVEVFLITGIDKSSVKLPLA